LKSDLAAGFLDGDFCGKIYNGALGAVGDHRLEFLDMRQGQLSLIAFQLGEGLSQDTPRHSGTKLLQCVETQLDLVSGSFLAPALCEAFLSIHFKSVVVGSRGLRQLGQGLACLRLVFPFQKRQEVFANFVAQKMRLLICRIVTEPDILTF